MNFFTVNDELKYLRKIYDVKQSVEKVLIESGFNYIEPSLFEDYTDVGEVNRKSKSNTIVVANDKSNLSILRIDNTQAILKNVVPKWDMEDKLKLFYYDNVYAHIDGKYEENRQLGIEIIGDTTLSSDFESITLALQFLEKSNNTYVFEISNSKLLSSICEELELDDNQINDLITIIATKNKDLLNEYIDNKLKIKEGSVLRNLFDCYGDIQSILESTAKYTLSDNIRNALHELEELDQYLKAQGLSNYVYDLSLVSQFKYYNGIIFKGFYKSINKTILRGGRYDKLTSLYGQNLGATGFMIDVDEYIKETQDNDYLVIALPKGRIGKSAVSIFSKLGLTECIDLDSRKLVFQDDVKKIKYMLLKNSDITTYVEKGTADVGIVGKDLIVENEPNVYELYNFNLGICKMSIAGIKDQDIYDSESVLKVGTKYTNCARKYFEKKGQNIELTKLNGSVELAPLMGLSHVIVDIVETGNTLRANGLEVLEEMFDINAMMIANKINYKFKRERITKIVNDLEEMGE